MSRRSVRAERLSRREQSGGLIIRRPSTTRPASGGMCVYCQERRATTRDHVFAECLFRRPLPVHMMTVPSCQTCNSGDGDGVPRPMKQDEEYARTVFSLMEGADRHQTASYLLKQTVMPGLRRSPALNWSFVRTMRPVQLVNEHGLILPEVKVAVDYDLSRVQRVLRKITKGVFFAIMGRPLPKTSHMRVFHQLEPRDFSVHEKVIHEAPQCTKYQEMQERTVVFVGGRNSPDRDDTAWLFLFYECFAACVYTASAENAQFINP